MFRKVKYIFLFFISTMIFPQDVSEEFDGKQEDLDIEILRNWIKKKRMVTIKQIGGDLSLSGEVRTEMKTSEEKKNGVQQRGRGGATDISICEYDVEVNVMLDYRTDRTWASIKLEFDNDMGQVRGTVNRIAVERAYFGAKLYDGETFTTMGTLGRRNLGDVFDSKLQYSSIYDGILLRMDKSSEVLADWYLLLGSLLVNDKKNHYAYVGEAALLKLFGTGLYTKYSFISWKRHYRDVRKNLAFHYQISQGIFGYQCFIAKWEKFLKVYLAGLLNHIAKKIELTNYKKANYGWYAGFSFGQIQKKKDFALEIVYQVLAAQTVPDFDVLGITTGNAQGIGFYTEDPYGEGPYTTRQTAVGEGNYKGIEIELLYAITNSITMVNNFQKSKTLDSSIGPKMKFWQYEIEFIYAF